QRAAPIVSPLLPTPDNLGVTHGHSDETDTRKPHHHRRFSRRSDVFLPDSRWEGVSRVRVRLPPLPRLSTETQGDLSRRRVPDATLALCPPPCAWDHHLASPVYDVSRGVHRAPALRLTLSRDALRRGPQRPVSHPRRPQFGAVCGDRAYLAHGPLPPRLCPWSAESGYGAHPVWSRTACLFSGR